MDRRKIFGLAYYIFKERGMKNLRIYFLKNQQKNNQLSGTAY